MNKELSPLEALSDLREDAKNHIPNHIEYLNERLDIIEKALKDYETMKEIRYTSQSDLKQVNKEHKALEIIKEKKVNVGLLLRCATVERYNKGICYEPKHLTKEEYDLLKEELK